MRTWWLDDPPATSDPPKPMPSPFERVAFVIPRRFVAAIERALASYRPGGSARTLEKIYADAWDAGVERRTRDVVAFGGARRELLVLLANDEALRERVREAPKMVRREMVEAAANAARRLSPLRKLAAPEIVIRGTLANVERAVAALDPARPLPREKRPPLADVGMVEGEPARGVHTHAWLESVLQHARDPASLVWSRVARASRTKASGVDLSSMRPGIESTSFSVDPRSALWCRPDTTLPRVLDERRIVVGDAGGPATYAFAGDPPSAELDGTIAKRLRALEPDDALVAFLWRGGGVDLAWRDKP